ncbi:MAG: phosphoribosyltransferase [Chitinophagaceae bacterium]|nr:phosphoribosyltransferase [Chitinophagaceae bacterium]
MPNTPKLILPPEIIDLKIQRMAYQIWEQNAAVSELVLIGIADNGCVLAEILATQLRSISPLKISIIRLEVDKANPLNSAPSISEDLNGQSVILVDDVSNSGKVALYALRAITAYMPSKISIAVLVDRKHKNYPVHPNIVGHSLSTTLQENITVVSDGTKLLGVYLD